MTSERDIILRAASLKTSPSPQADARILAAAEAALNRAARSGHNKPLRAVVLGRPAVRWTAAAILTIGVAIAAWYSAATVSRLNRPSPHAVVTVAPAEPNQPTAAPVTTSRVNDELAQAAECFNKKDVDGLIGLLDTGLAPTKVAAAGYLADLNTPKALPSLQRLAATWTGDPNANPFARAAATIKAPGQEPNQPPAGRTQSQGLAPAGTVSGRRTIKIKVVDALTGQALAGTKISGSLSEGPFLKDRSCASDANGCCEFDVNEASSCSVWTSNRPGYVGRCMEFAELTEQVLGQSHVFSLDRGVKIGGVVQDPNGVPLLDAKINVRLQGSVDIATRSSVHVAFTQQTDAAGRWLCDTVPADLPTLAADHAIQFYAEHPDYLDKHMEVNDPPTLGAMLGLVHVTVLRHGATLCGRVVNEQGEPIPGATVNSHITQGDGTFVLRNIDPNSATICLTASADRYPRLLRRISNEPNMREVEIVLCRPGLADMNALRRYPGWFASGRVVDAAGLPLAGAEVIAHEGRRYLIGIATDAAGRYLVGPLPEPRGIMNIQVDATGFMQTFRVVERPVQEPMDFVLHRKVHVSGRVLDSEGARPLDRFRVRTCNVDDGGQIRPSPYAEPGKAGRYEYTFEASCETGYAIAIEADGYQPAVTRVIGPEEQEPVIDLVLTHGTGLAGTVLDANGLTVAEAWVYAVPGDNQAWYWTPFAPPSPAYHGPLLPDYSWVRSKTDGSFSFEPIYELRHLVAVAKQGICSGAVSESSKARHLVLQPWSRVQGVVDSGDGEPVSGQSIEMASLPEAGAASGFKWSLSTETIDHGVFQVEWVPPGKFTLLGKTYEVAPGQTLTLDLTVNP